MKKGFASAALAEAPESSESDPTKSGVISFTFRRTVGCAQDEDDSVRKRFAWLENLGSLVWTGRFRDGGKADPVKWALGSGPSVGCIVLRSKSWAVI